MRLGLLLWACVMLVGVAADGGGLVRPEGRILDQARLFDRMPERLAALEAEAGSFSQRRGFEVYVAIFDTLIESGVNEMAYQLADEWLGGKPGVVMVFESDGGRIACEWVRAKVRTDEQGHLVRVPGQGYVSPVEELRVWQRLRGLGPLERSSAAAVEGAVGELLGALEAGFEGATQAGERSRSRSLRLALLALCAVIVSVVVGLLIRPWAGQGPSRALSGPGFPEVEVAQRLGAPHGGGMISSRSFADEPRTRS